MMVTSAIRHFNGEDDLADDGADQLFAFTQRGGRGVEDRLDVRAGPGDPVQLVGGQGNGAAGFLGGQVVLGAPQRGELVLQRAFQGAGDQPVLRFDRVVLAHRAVGVEAGAFDGGLEHGEVGPPLLLGLGHGLGGRGQRGGLQHLEQLVQHQLLDLAAADGLADPFGPEVELGLDAFVARAAAGPAGCAA